MCTIVNYVVKYRRCGRNTASKKQHFQANASQRQNDEQVHQVFDKSLIRREFR